MTLPHLLLTVIFCSSGFVIQLTHGFYPKVAIINDDQATNRWISASKDFDTIAWSHADRIQEMLTSFIQMHQEQMSSSTKNSKQTLQRKCFNSLKLLSGGLKSRKFWSYQLIDAWSRGDVALAYGGVTDLGKRGACINVAVANEYSENASDVPRDKMMRDPANRENRSGESHQENSHHQKEDGTSFRGKYCIVRVTFPVASKGRTAWSQEGLAEYRLNVSGTELSGTIYEYYADHIAFFFYPKSGSFSFGICIPDTCSHQETNEFLASLSNKSELRVELRPYCDAYSERQEMETCSICSIMSTIFWTYIGIVVGFSLICDLKDYWDFDLKYESFFRHFHVKKNTERLLSDYHNPEYQKMRLFDTTKTSFQIFAISTHAIIIGVIFPQMFPPMGEYRDGLKLPEAGKELLLRFTYGTQVLVTLSGFFTGYLVFPMIQKSKGEIPFYLFALKRWLRTAPTVGGVIILTFAATSMTSHPVAREALDIFTDACTKSWWQTLFLINNYGTPIVDMCIIQTWFISVDFQLWLLSYVPLMLLYKRPKAGVILCILLMMIGIISNSLIAYLKGLPAYPTGREMDIFLFMIHNTKFIPWHFYVNSGLFNYFLGILTAYYCLTQKPIRSQFSLRWIIFCMAWGGVQGFILLFPTVWRFYLKWPSSQTLEIIYSGFVRLPFGIFIVMPLMCVYYGFVESYPLVKYCQNRFWVVTGRLAFSVYLSHLLTVVFVGTTLYEKIPGETLPLCTFFLVYVVVCFAVGYLIHVLIEAPFNNLLSDAIRRKLPMSTGLQDANSKHDTQDDDHNDKTHNNGMK